MACKPVSAGSSKRTLPLSHCPFLRRCPSQQFSRHHCHMTYPLMILSFPTALEYCQALRPLSEPNYLLLHLRLSNGAEGE